MDGIDGNHKRYETIYNKIYFDGAHSINVQNVTSNCKVTTLISFFSLYLARRLAS